MYLWIPSRIVESPDGEPFSALPSDSRKAGYSALSFGAQAQTTVKTHSPIQRDREATLSSIGGKKTMYRQQQHGNWDHKPLNHGDVAIHKGANCHLITLLCYTLTFINPTTLSVASWHILWFYLHRKSLCLFIFVELLKKFLFEITRHLKNIACSSSVTLAKYWSTATATLFTSKKWKHFFLFSMFLHAVTGSNAKKWTHSTTICINLPKWLKRSLIEVP